MLKMSSVEGGGRERGATMQLHTSQVTEVTPVQPHQPGRINNKIREGIPRKKLLTFGRCPKVAKTPRPPPSHRQCNLF